MNRNHAFSLMMAFFLAACGGGHSIVDQLPQGLMEGEDWTMVSAVVEDRGDTLSVELFPVQVDECDSFASADSQIMFTVKKELGEYPLNFSFTDIANSQTVTFYTPEGVNVIASEGLIVVETLSEDEVTIGLVADMDDSSVNGRFTTKICPNPF